MFSLGKGGVGESPTAWGHQGGGTSHFHTSQRRASQCHPPRHCISPLPSPPEVTSPCAAGSKLGWIYPRWCTGNGEYQHTVVPWSPGTPTSHVSVSQHYSSQHPTSGSPGVTHLTSHHPSTAQPNVSHPNVLALHIPHPNALALRIPYPSAPALHIPTPHTPMSWHCTSHTLICRNPKVPHPSVPILCTHTSQRHGITHSNIPHPHDPSLRIPTSHIPTSHIPTSWNPTSLRGHHAPHIPKLHGAAAPAPAHPPQPLLLCEEGSLWDPTSPDLLVFKRRSTM